ncbi:hypothetical protein TNCV_1054991 [Trichonephila clavipes]|nr:hypothetical protein TNCV_1054991 [Trichonephila clavipes]
MRAIGKGGAAARIFCGLMNLPPPPAKVNFIESEKSVSGSHREGLIEKCLHGRTQNPNESFNKCIWERIPKTVFVGIET